MFYERKIKYFSYMENGERVRGAGFVRLEARDELCFLSLQINNLGVSNYTKTVFLTGDGREGRLCELQIKQGRGMAEFQLPCDNLCGGIAYQKLSGIRMSITPGKEVYCEMREESEQFLSEGKSQNEISRNEKMQSKKHKAEISQHEMADSEKYKTEILQQEMADSEKPKREISQYEISENEKLKQEITQYEITENEKPKQEMPQYGMSESGKCKQMMLHHEMSQSDKPATPKMQNEKAAEVREQRVILQENKWKQLSQIYEHIAPFGDERDYLSIGPGDFVILPEKYYRLVNNSFLLHGYYNYRHLILTKVLVRGEGKYYIGVPGNFYEREKQVALMFGFESFECQEEPAKDGDYGYYMIRVEL